MQNGILFLGDSFTWGEGLELYCDTPKWIEERTQQNGWPTLSTKQDEDGIRFREENRFSRLVANHFGKIDCVNDTNGGCVAGYINVAHKFLFDPDIRIDTIIIQFSILDREPIHGSFSCVCDFCKATGYHRYFEQVEHVIAALINGNLTDNQKEALIFFEKKTNRKATDNDFLDALINVRGIWYSNLVHDFYVNHILHWEASGKRKIYYIDSWDNETSYKLHNSIIPIDKKGIPLIGEDDRKYQIWTKWENSFEFKNISQQFVKTGNGHPTLKQHQHLAKSIIQFLEERQ
jgi:hypothetical protein